MLWKITNCHLRVSESERHRLPQIQQELEREQLQAWKDYHDPQLKQKREKPANLEHVETSQTLWQELEGAELEPALRSGAVALLDAQWLVNYAYPSLVCDDECVVLPRRQDLPPEAFLSLPEMQQSCSGNNGWHYGRNGLHIICLSYMWLHPHHPDPKGTTLQLVARWCMDFLVCNVQQFRTARSFGVFWDYGSLYQPPRTTHEDELFRQGLTAMPTFFSHPHTYSFQVTQFPPDGYPCGYNLPEDSNRAAYQDRGWPVVESCWISLSKNSSMTRDLCRDEIKVWGSRHRQVPLSPDKVEEKLQMVSFTNAHKDKPLVLELYKNEFVRRFRLLRTMRFGSLGWGDNDILQLSDDVLGAGYCPNLKRLELCFNSFGVEGCTGLARALLNPENGFRGKLLHLQLTNNSKLDAAAVEALSEAILEIPSVSLDHTAVDVSACQSLVVTAKKKMESSGCRKDVRLSTLQLSRNLGIGDQGLEILLELVWLLPSLTSLDVRCCDVTDIGCQAIASSICEKNDNDDSTSGSTIELNLKDNRDITGPGLETLLTSTAGNSRFHFVYDSI